MAVSPKPGDQTNQRIEPKPPIDARNPDEVVHQPTQTLKTLVNLHRLSRGLERLVEAFAAFKFVRVRHRF